MLNQYTHRKAALSDIPRIMELVGDARQYLASMGVDQWQDGYPTADIFEADINAGSCWVFLSGGEILGVETVSFAPETDYEGITDGAWLQSGPYGVIHRSALDRRARGSGLADELFSLAEALCRERGAKSLRVDTHRDNLPMQHVCARHGLIRCGVVYLYGELERIGYEKLL